MKQFKVSKFNIQAVPIKGKLSHDHDQLWKTYLMIDGMFGEHGNSKCLHFQGAIWITCLLKHTNQNKAH